MKKSNLILNRCLSNAAGIHCLAEQNRVRLVYHCSGSFVCLYSHSAAHFAITKILSF